MKMRGDDNVQGWGMGSCKKYRELVLHDWAVHHGNSSSWSMGEQNTHNHSLPLMFVNKHKRHR